MVYAFNTRNERKELWSYLSSLSRGWQIPWIIIGDFNSVLRIDDRIRGNPITMSEIVDFSECAEEREFIELPQHGSRYTSNDRHGETRVDSKIDWAFVNRQWLDNMPAYIDNFLLEGYKMYQIVYKLKQLKKSLQELNRQHFRNILTEANEDREALEKIQKELQLKPGEARLQAQEKENYQKFRRSSYLAEIFLLQRSKGKWIKLGDDNTRYFFSVIKHRKLQQAITQLKNKDGQLQTEPDSIAQILVDFYQDMLGRKSNHRVKTFKSILHNGKRLTL
ncbi:uncharacterized protein LOC107767911 [Nicotiana tabacum]|uniref:Uncharacterized protein LOC107767911 n=1 Tax=Nicotiana tabacum TaxID=4097 RepID=A0A1S3XRK7_TOBAC|nr:uncharacterized protein LOC104119964 [Nicotiana tomentosiformis]XP_016442510.1 PREDICTED: uncharacterized protein LOC107767911 [Nicotiana tabacum]